MRKIKILIPVILALLTACQLQKVVVGVYTPSRLIIPPEVRSFLVTSRFVPATGPYEDVQWGAYESVDSLKWLFSESIVDTLGKLMARDNKYLVKIRHFPRMLRHNEANLPEPLPWQGLTDLTKKEYVQALLILEGFDLTKTPVAFEEKGGSIEAAYSLNVTLALRIYEPEKMRMIDDSVYTFTTEFKGTGTTREDALKQLPADQEGAAIACTRAAEAYFSLINPGEISATRHYYSRGDSALLKAERAIQEGRWGRAESTWKWMAYNGADSALQAKASFNMALACERDGRLNQAIGFARRSQRLQPDKRTADYIDLLVGRNTGYEEQVKQKQLIKKW